MKSYLALILGMALVTYLPRLIPLITLSERPLPPLVKRFLLYIPYAALGALIFPGVAQATPSLPLAAWVGIGVAVLAAWYQGGLIISVLSSVAATFLVIWTWGG